MPWPEISREYFAKSWFDEIQGRVPGLLLCIVVALAAQWMSERFGYPALLVALILGLMLRPAAPSISTGVNFAARRVLEFGVALLGFRMTVETVMSLGISTFFVVALALVATISFATFLAPVFGCDRRTGLLAGGATAICGSSACLAVASVLPRDRRSDQVVSVVIIGVTVFSTISMLLYPFLAGFFGLSDQAAGVVLGGSIHNVPQAIAAGYTVSDAAGATATLTKLLRVFLLLPVIATLAMLAPRILRTAGTSRAPKERVTLPWFLFAFLLALLANSFGVVSPDTAEALSELSTACLVVSIAAVGLKTSVNGLLREGWRPLVLILAATLFLLGFLLAAVRIGAV